MDPIEINCSEFSKNFSSSLTVEDLLLNESINLNNHGKIISALQVDGKEKELSNTSFLKTEISNLNKILFKTSSKKELLEDTASTLSKILDGLIKSLQELVKEEQLESNEPFTITCLDHILKHLGIFQQLVSHLNHSLKQEYAEGLYHFKIVKKIQIHHLSILKMLKKSQDSNDNIMLCDLLEYELSLIHI